MERITMHVDGASHQLAQGQDPDTIKRAVVQAARDGADMVKVTVVGNRELDVLVTPGIPITFESETVSHDARDDGDLTSPFDARGFDEYA
jgi:DhnA family fructose-bisphosphate aldolase class Ia